MLDDQQRSPMLSTRECADLSHVPSLLIIHPQTSLNMTHTLLPSLQTQMDVAMTLHRLSVCVMGNVDRPSLLPGHMTSCSVLTLSLSLLQHDSCVRYLHQHTIT